MMRTALLLCAFGWAQEERIDDADYDKYFAVHVKAVEAIGKTWRKDPAAALRALEPVLKSIESELAPRFPRHVETTLAIRQTRGIDKGDVKERHDFRPYRLAGEVALAAGRPDLAVAHLEKSPSSATLLAEARKAASVPLLKPAVDLRPFLDRDDFLGALEALQAAREKLGAEFGERVREVHARAASHQKAGLETLAAVLPRLHEPGFRKDHLEPCLRACSRVPAAQETDELRWARRLDRWMETRDATEFHSLALAALKFDPDFHVLCDRAQDERIVEIERIVDRVIRSPRSEREALLDRMGAAERAFLELSAGRERPENRDRLARLKARLPIDDQALTQARAGAATLAAVRRLAGELDLVWSSDRRARLSLPDQADLALYLGVYRCYALFLDGKSVEEAAKDPRVIEVFRGAPELPADVSPKVAAVRALLKSSQK